MKVALLLFNYFPFGGLQRDCLKTAQACAQRGHAVTIFTRTWQGDRPESIEIRLLGEHGLTNIARNNAFVRQVNAMLPPLGFDAIVGFNKMPGLDVYYGADPCFAAKSARMKGWWYRWTPRYRHYYSLEHAVFQHGARTEILLLTDKEIPAYQQFHGAERERFHLLPPGIDRRIFSPEEQQAARNQVRAEHSWRATDRLLLLVGSGFRTKGLDRAIRTLASLPADLRDNTRLVVIGQDRPSAFERLARQLNVPHRVCFLGGRHDVFRFLLAADVLIHPAYSEAAGMVLLEALTAGLPVIATDVCGYAPHVIRANAGTILPSPFDQAACDRAALTFLASPQGELRQNALKYAATADLYSCHSKAVDRIEAAADRKRNARGRADPHVD